MSHSSSKQGICDWIQQKDETTKNRERGSATCRTGVDVTEMAGKHAE